MLGINARVEDLREQIIKDINKAQMPACILDYILTEILNDVRLQRMSEVQKERQKYKQETTPVPGEVPVRKGDGRGGIIETGRVKVEKKTLNGGGADGNSNPDS